MLSIPKYPEQYAQHFPAIFYLLCCTSQHHVMFSSPAYDRDISGCHMSSFLCLSEGYQVRVQGGRP